MTNLDLRIVLVYHLQKTKKEYKNCETGESRQIYKYKIDKACFQNDMVYSGFSYLPRTTPSDKVLHYKQMILLKIQNIMDVKGVLLQWFINLLIMGLLHLEIKLLVVVLLKVKIYYTNSCRKNCTSQLIKNLKNVRNILLLKAAFGLHI